MIRSRVTYGKPRADLDNPNYRILYELARDGQTEIPFVRLNLSCETEVEIKSETGSANKITLSLHAFDPAGNTSWKGFDLGFLLSPDSATIHFVICSKRDLREIKFRSSHPIGFTDRGSRLEASIPDYDRASDTLVMNMDNISFDTASADHFVQNIRLIDNYFQSSVLLDSLLKRVSRYRTDSLAISAETYIDILMFSKAVNMISADSITDSIARSSNDPAQLVSHNRNAFRISKSLAYTFSDRIKEFRKDQGTGDLAIHASFFVERICWFIRQSVGLELSGGGIFRDYLEHFYILEGFPDDKEMFLGVAELLYPNKSADGSALVLSYEVFYAYVNKAKELMALHEFAEAVLLLKHANLFLASNPWMTDKPDVGKLLAEAYQGIYNSYLAIATAGIENERYNMAGLYLEKARQFRAQVSVTLPGDTLYNTLSHQLSLQSVEVAPVTDRDTVTDVLAIPEPETLTTQQILAERPMQPYDRRCADLREEAEVLMIRAERNLSSKRYIAAVNQMKSIMAIEDTALSCEIRIPGVRDSLDKYLPAYDFLIAKQEMTNNIAVGFYATAVDQVFELNETLQEKNLTSFGLEPVSLSAEILDRLSQSLCIASINKYLSLGNCPEALYYIRLFQQIGGVNTLVEDLQEKTAMCLAVSDYKKQNGGFCVEAIRQYGLDGSWFKPFRNAYQRSWSDLENVNNSDQPFLPE